MNLIHEQRKQPRSRLLNCGWVILVTLVNLILADGVRAEVKLQIGIIQRFGQADRPTALRLASTPGNTLTLTVPGEPQPQSLKTEAVTLEIEAAELSQPVVSERLVLSDHSTFETAEDSAEQWRERGLAVEITQPDRWQVWAKRAVYRTPLLRRLLLESLKNQGINEPYLETALLRAKPRVTFTVAGKHYSLTEIQIVASDAQIRVGQGKTPQDYRLYGGSLKVQPNAYGTYTLVNEVGLETYLRGVVPHEIGPQAPAAAIAAQTIIARTYALRNLRRFEADNYQLCADTHCQVYYGLSGTSPQADRAIAATKGLVLTYNNELVDALYSSTTGGVTANFSDIWNGEERPYLRPIVDAPTPLWNLSQESLADEQAFRRFIALNQGFNETGRNVFRWHRQSTLEQLSE
ncbi:MAG: SpoIID/LytB domain-containing protein, partial [Chloroflexaceae bacterium]|nr:SpoIID/LytB domain-containing protein [Chloroflexaceae bacterium]